MKNSSSKERLSSWDIYVAIFIIIELAISLYPYHYGIFRDEFLYISMSDHLGLGYLEVPPLPALVLAIVRFFLGTSIFSLHIVPALTGSAVIFITALMVKRLGGNLFALILTLVCVTLAPIYIGHNSVFTYDCFDHLFWTLSIYFIVMILTTEARKYWIFFGISAGLGLLSKITMLYLGLGILLAFLFTKDRKKIFNVQFLIGGIISLFIALPYIIWQAQNEFPIIEYFKNYTDKVDKMSPIRFMIMQVIVLNPIASIVWIMGLMYFLFSKEGKKFRVLGLIYIIIALLFMLQQTKYYLLVPYYPILFSGGSIFLNNILDKDKLLWFKTVFISLIAAVSILFMPMVRPVLKPETFAQILINLGLGSNVGSAEKYKSSALPQQFADMFGWKEMTQNISKVYNSLNPEEKKKTCIFAENYGEAGAIHYYRVKYNLPDPICAHNIHYLWGPGNNSGQIMIIVGYSKEDKKTLEKYFGSVTVAGKVFQKYAMPHENNKPIYLCRNIKVNLKYVWKRLKHFG